MQQNSSLKILRFKAYNALCSIKNNYTMPTKATITKICQSLNIPSAYLLFFSIQDEDLPKDSQTVLASKVFVIN